MAIPPPELEPANKPRPRKPDEGVDFELFQGPLPHVEDFAAYDRVLPGAAHRILKMAERDQKARLRQNVANWFTAFAAMILGRLFLYALVGAAELPGAIPAPTGDFCGSAPILR